MESLILLRLIGKTAVGMYPRTLVTGGVVFGGWLQSAEYHLLWSLPSLPSDPAVLGYIIFSSHPSSPSYCLKFTLEESRSSALPPLM